MLLIAALVALVFLYSTLLAPGREHAEYTDFAERSGPWLSILVGGPLFYLFGRLLSRRIAPSARRIGLVVWALYSLTDAALVLASGAVLTPLFVAQWLASQAVKLLGMQLGTRRAG